MFSQFTWSEFTLAVAGVSVAYYITVVLLYYRVELRNGFKTQATIAKDDSQHPAPMMGPSKPYGSDRFADQNIKTVSSEEVVVDQSKDEEDTEASEGSLQTSIQSLSQFLKEAKVLATAARQDGLSLEESSSLFRALIDKYAHLKQGGYADAVSILLHRMITESLPHHIQLVEVERWWTS